MFDTNVLGTLLGMKHEMRVMAAQGGSIVNLSSVLGKVGAPGAAVYTASMHAVEGLADTILFLACKAPFLTGQSIVVDGEKTAS